MENVQLKPEKAEKKQNTHTYKIKKFELNESKVITNIVNINPTVIYNLIVNGLYTVIKRQYQSR